MIKNYTSTVPANKSVMHIEKRLVDAGAKNIMKQYDNEKNLSGVCFTIETNPTPVARGSSIPFKLPARIDRVEKALLKNIKKPRKGTQEKMKEQAARTAWKLLSDWVDIQVSLIELEQADIIEVFLPYVYNHVTNGTFYDKIRDGGFKMLQAPIQEI